MAKTYEPSESVFFGDCFPKKIFEEFFTQKRWLTTRVARWFIFKPKIQIWVNFKGP
jgi:hypothetical protein